MYKQQNRTMIKAIRLFVAAALLAASLAALVPPPVARAATITVDVDTPTDSNDAAYQACDGATANDCSLRGAISKANGDTTNDYVINVPANTYTLSLAGADEDANATGDLDITSTAAITITGDGADSTVIDADSIDRVLHVQGGTDVTLQNLKLTNGLTPDGGSCSSDSCYAGDGGGVYNDQGTLTITDSTLSGNTTGNGGSCTSDYCRAGGGGDGGGVHNDQGTLTITGSTVSGNTTGNGGTCDGEECYAGIGGDGGRSAALAG